MDASNFSELWVCIKLLTSFRNIAMDRCCNAQMIAESTGRKLKVLDHKTASLTRDQVGSNWAYVAIHVRCPLIMLMSNACKFGFIVVGLWLNLTLIWLYNKIQMLLTRLVMPYL